MAEFLNAKPAWEFAFDFDPQTPFADYVARMDDWARGLRVPENFVPNTYFVGVVDGEIVGRLSLRHRLNDWLALVGGHIGYGVVPSHRGRGHATEMLRQALPHCARLGLTRALLSCDEDNLASRAVIERNGGVFDGYSNRPDLDGRKRRYWIPITHSPEPAPGAADPPRRSP